jgi:hypothetical protein
MTGSEIPLIFLDRHKTLGETGRAADTRQLS